MTTIKAYATGTIAALGIAGAALIGAGSAAAATDHLQTTAIQSQSFGDPSGQNSNDHVEPGQHHHGNHRAHHHGRG
jgi:hypothetical protein